MDDPKTRSKAAEPDDASGLRAQVAALSAQVAQLVGRQAHGGGITAEQLTAILTQVTTAQAEAHAAAMREIAERDRRDDVNYPRISVYSYPEGDRKRPRPAFKCRLLWLGYELDWDTTTAAEIELLNRIEPGEYTFRRISGVAEKLSVTGERSADGRLTKLDFLFPTKENRDTLPSMHALLRDALGVKTAEQAELERLRAQIATLTANQPVTA